MKLHFIAYFIGTLLFIKPLHCDATMYAKDVLPCKQNKKTQSKKQVKTEDQHLEGFSVWELSKTSDFKDNFFPIKEKGHIYSQALGMEYKVNEGFNVGAFYLFDRLNARTPINTSKLHENINSFYPYFYYYFMPGFFLNVVAGYGHTATKIKQIDDSTGMAILGKSKGNIQAFIPSLVGQMEQDNFLADVYLNYLYYSYKEKSYVESNSNVVPSSRTTRNNLELLANIGYRFKDIGSGVKSISPYVILGIDHDVKPTKIRSPFLASVGQKFNRGRSGYTGGALINVLFANDAMLELKYKYTYGHSHLKINTYSLNLRFNF